MQQGRGVVAVIIAVVVVGFLLLGLLGSLFMVRSTEVEQARVRAAEEHRAEAERRAAQVVSQTRLAQEQQRDADLDARSGERPPLPDSVELEAPDRPGLRSYRVLRRAGGTGLVVVDPQGSWMLFDPGPLAGGRGTPLPRPVDEGGWELNHGTDVVRFDPAAGAPFQWLEFDASRGLKMRRVRLKGEPTPMQLMQEDRLEAVLELSVEASAGDGS